MSKLILDLDLDRCCACGACAIACMDQNDIDTAAETPLRNVFTLENAGKGTVKYLSIGCMHCSDAPCIMACPVGCLSKDPKTDLTVYDSENCIGCHSCALVCPFGAPSFDKNGKMRKCDGCVTRLENGYEPACVRTCTVDALQIYTEEEQKQNRISSSLRKITDLIG